MIKGKNKKIKIMKIYLFLTTSLLYKEGGELEVVVTPPPPTFFTAKIFETFFHRYMGIWTRLGKFTEWQS